jgi:hypothetical protein
MSRMANVSTPFSFRDMARVRLPKLSTELLAVVSCLESVLTTVPYLSCVQPKTLLAVAENLAMAMAS